MMIILHFHRTVISSNGWSWINVSLGRFFNIYDTVGLEYGELLVGNPLPPDIFA